MDLGMAEERCSTANPDAARALLTKARGDAREALAELRDLARGIRPALLSERGLGAALEALAARTPLPTTVDRRLDERLPAAVESAVYFVVAEALTNAVKHGGAARPRAGRAAAATRLRGRGRATTATAAPTPAAAGSTGLRQRVAALDGTLTRRRPAGGPTVVHAELPCAS